MAPAPALAPTESCGSGRFGSNSGSPALVSTQPLLATCSLGFFLQTPRLLLPQFHLLSQTYHTKAWMLSLSRLIILEKMQKVTTFATSFVFLHSQLFFLLKLFFYFLINMFFYNNLKHSLFY